MHNINYARIGLQVGEQTVTKSTLKIIFAGVTVTYGKRKNDTSSFTQLHLTPDNIFRLQGTTWGCEPEPSDLHDEHN